MTQLQFISIPMNTHTTFLGLFILTSREWCCIRNKINNLVFALFVENSVQPLLQDKLFLLYPACSPVPQMIISLRVLCSCLLFTELCRFSIICSSGLAERGSNLLFMSESMVLPAPLTRTENRSTYLDQML